MNLGNALIAAGSSLRRWANRATEPQVLFPAIALLLLGLVWGTSLHLINVERAGAEREAVAIAGELAKTYEAQLVRALREIDYTLKLVKYTVEFKQARINLSDLKGRSLLPSDVAFVVSITDADGNVVASTRPSKSLYVGDRDYFQILERQRDAFTVGTPQRSADSGEWKQYFSRRLDADDGTFAGIVMVDVDAAYFVSGYETRTLGERGLLGLVGNDGSIRAGRTGKALLVGVTVNYTSGAPDAEAALVTNAWDGVVRYVSIRRLVDFPVAVIVGLAQDEQLANARRNQRAALWAATAGSILLIAVVAILGRMSWQLAQGRLRAVEEQRANAERVQYLAYHDSLTTLPNRSLFTKLLTQSIHEAHRFNRQLAVLFLDIDRFKHINDTLGHEAGDQLLQEVATRLNGCLRESDTVARLGGDEFVVLLPELDEDKYVATVAQKILSAVAKPFVLHDQEFRVTASVGICTYPQDGLDEETLTKNADIAMYRAKEEGKNNYQFYSAKLNADSLERLTLESRLRHALENHEFELYYQAKRNLPDGRITGMEALLRWKHPDLGMVAPMKFIPVAEELGLMVPIGKWVLKTACLQNVTWQKQGLPHLSMAVNLTSRQFFDENLLPDLTLILDASGMDAHLLELEFTESVLMQNIEMTLRILSGLKGLGIRIAVDDFGIGYSSVATLTQFPLDTIKIDRSFIRNVAGNVQDKNLTAAIIAMGGALSLTVVAQGVETKEQADFLRAHACEEIQGFYFYKPVPAEQFAELLQTQAGISDFDSPPAENA
jgi:diguanylate cyclase (GGDEF)-like protein